MKKKSFALTLAFVGAATISTAAVRAVAQCVPAPSGLVGWSVNVLVLRIGVATTHESTLDPRLNGASTQAGPQPPCPAHLSH